MFIDVYTTHKYTIKIPKMVYKDALLTVRLGNALARELLCHNHFFLRLNDHLIGMFEFASTPMAADANLLVGLVGQPDLCSLHSLVYTCLHGCTLACAPFKLNVIDS